MRTEVPQHSYRLLLTGGLLSTEQSLLPLQKPPQFVHENANKLQLVPESVLHYWRRLPPAAQDLTVISQLYNNLVCNCQRLQGKKKKLSMKMPTDCFYHVPSIKKWYIHMIIMNIWSTQISTHQWWRYRTAPMMCNWTAGDWSDFPVRSWLIQYWSMGETGPMCRPNQIGCDFFAEVNAINLFDWKSHEQTCANYNEREGKTSSWIKYIFSYNGIMPIRFHEGALSLQWSRVLASACSGGMDKATWGAAW